MSALAVPQAMPFMSRNTTRAQAVTHPDMRPRLLPPEIGDADTHELQPGPVRRAVERAGGLIGSVWKIPCAALPCLVGGTLLGARISSSPARIALAMDAANVLQSSVGLALALSVGGGPGAFAHAFVTKGLLGGLTVAMVCHEGSSDLLARELGQAIERVHPADGGRFSGAVKGAAIGLKLAVVGGAKVGYGEGRGYVCGVYEGLGGGWPMLDPSWDELRAQPLRTSVTWAKAAAVAAQTVPAGLAQGLAESMTGRNLWTPNVQFASAALEGLVIGAIVGHCIAAGTVSTALGGTAGMGAGIALAALARPTRQIAAVRDAVHAVAQRSPKLGDLVAERNRDFVCGALVGAAAGLRAPFSDISISSTKVEVPD